MAPKTRIKTKAVAVNVPQSRESAAQAIAEIGRLSRDLARASAAMNDELAEVKARHEELAEPVRCGSRRSTKACRPGRKPTATR